MNTKKVGQLILMGITGTKVDSETADIIKLVQPGGIILFGRNIESPIQLRQLIEDIRDLSDEEPIITIDQEGGRVSRLRLIGNEPPSAMALTSTNDLKLIANHGKLTGLILRQYGFNLNLCPVLDITSLNDNTNSLRGRCYGSNPNQVIRNAATFNRSMKREGILSCGKHFPGYTYADCDAHESLPTINRSREQWESEECAPFMSLLPDLDSVMICHSHYPFFEENSTAKPLPASLSKNVVTNTLRNQLGFDNGLVMTDDLDMGAIINEFGFEETVRKAILAGNDLIMICHRSEMALEASNVLQQMPEIDVIDSLQRVQRTKEKLTAPMDFCLDTVKEINEMIWKLRVETLGEELAKESSIEDGKRSPVEEY